MKVTAAEPTATRVGIILLTLATATIHFTLNFPGGSFSFDPMFTLNGLGYLAFLAALFLDIPWAKDHRRLVRLAMIAYTAITIFAWIILGDKAWWVGWTAKAIEVLLIFLLALKRP